jgi:hypothetical protein
MDEIIAAAIGAATELVKRHVQALPPEESRRLGGLERVLGEIVDGFAEGLWCVVDQELGRQAEQEAGRCECGRKRQANRSEVTVSVRDRKVTFHATYFYCKTCRVGDAPMRRWLDIHEGAVSMGTERSVTTLTTKLTFGEAAQQMKEHHHHEMDRTKLERVTYAVAKDGVEYLGERRIALREVAESSARTSGSPVIELMADGGGVRTGVLTRPEPGDGVPLTPVRQLPRGSRNIARREVRLVVAKRPSNLTDRVTDLHIAPLGHPEVSGERMLFAAMEAGARDNTHIHGVFDMGTWIHPQFEEQFQEHSHTAVVDIIHVTEYLCEAGKSIVGPDGSKAWGLAQKALLLEGMSETVIRSLGDHRCTEACHRDDDGLCLAKVALRYLRNHRKYLDYPTALALGLSVGSGEAESGIRHFVRFRMDVAGSWREDHAALLLALVAIRACGWWDNFWSWRDRKDIDRWKERLAACRPAGRATPRTEAA